MDEAWLLMRDPEGAKFLFRLAKSARKAWAGLAAVTQDAGDVLSTDLGRAVIANSATQILLRQAPQAIGKVAEEFRLSAGERQLLLSARRGEGLLAAGPSARVSFQALASPAEHYLCTTSPEFLASLEAEEANSGMNSYGDQVSPRVRRTRGTTEGRRYAGNPEHDRPGSAGRGSDTPACSGHRNTIRMPCSPRQSTAGTPCRQDCALSIWPPCPGPVLHRASW